MWAVLAANDYEIARLLIERGLAAIYLIGFVVALVQFPALAGEHGLDPAPDFLRSVRFADAPSVFHVRYSDNLLRVVALVGAALAALVLLGVASALPLPLNMLVWLSVWFLYLSIMNIGGTFYGFGWESQLCETGLIAIFLGTAEFAAPFVVLLLLRWLAFRVEFGAGLIKLRGDACWRKLTCMEYHHETQPLPNPLSWFAHHLPRAFHRLEAVGNFAAQLVLPWGLFLPQPFASAAAVLMIGTQLYLVVTGNYSWLNWITIVALLAAISDSAIALVFPGVAPVAAAAAAPSPDWFNAAALTFAIIVAVLSYWPVRNLISSRQAMNRSFNAWHLVNTYGAFGSVTRRRYEVIVEATDDFPITPQTEWREYEFKAKPGDPKRVPRQIAPYHLRLDWMMWFIPISPAYAGEWFFRFLERLLEADRATLRLLRRDPFSGRRPAFVRARLFEYRYTSVREWRDSGAWWERQPVGELVPAMRLKAST
jgi:hypothetical protein